MFSFYSTYLVASSILSANLRPTAISFFMYLQDVLQISSQDQPLLSPSYQQPSDLLAVLALFFIHRIYQDRFTSIIFTAGICIKSSTLLKAMKRLCELLMDMSRSPLQWHLKLIELAQPQSKYLDTEEGPVSRLGFVGCAIALCSLR